MDCKFCKDHEQRIKTYDKGNDDYVIKVCPRVTTYTKGERKTKANMIGRATGKEYTLKYCPTCGKELG